MSGELHEYFYSCKKIRFYLLSICLHSWSRIFYLEMTTIFTSDEENVVLL